MLQNKQKIRWNSFFPKIAGLFFFGFLFLVATPSGLAAGLTITTSSYELARATQGVTYSQVISSTGVGSLTWSVSSGNLPDGLSLNSETGEISGVPTNIATYDFTLHATDSFGNDGIQGFTLKVHAPIFITTETLQDVTARTPYSRNIEVSGGVAPLTWSIDRPSSNELTIDSSTGVISGIFQNQGGKVFEVTVTDANSESISKEFTLIAKSSLQIGIPTTNSGEMPKGREDHAYSQALVLTGGVGPFTWSVESGSLPVGLTLNSATGEISGVPTVVGSSSFTVRVTDVNGATKISQLATVTIDPFIYINDSFYPATVSGVYSYVLEALDGIGSLTWSIISGTLPPGVSLNTSTGIVSGIPTTEGTYSFVLQVMDSVGHINVQQQSLIVYPVQVITTTGLPQATVGASYSKTIQWMNYTGTPDFVWSISSGYLPEGLSLDAVTGIISGTPTSAGTSNFTVQSVDRWGVIETQVFSIVVNKALTIKKTKLPDRRIGQNYSQTISTQGGTGPITWDLVLGAGHLPDDLFLNSATGEISGTLVEPAMVYNFTVQVTDAAGAVDTQAYTIEVKP